MQFLSGLLFRDLNMLSNTEQPQQLELHNQLRAGEQLQQFTIFTSFVHYTFYKLLTFQ